MTTQTTRRALLGGAGLAAAAAAAPVTAAAIGQSGPDRSTWDAAWQAYEAAKASDEKIDSLYKASDEAGQAALSKEWDASGARLGDAEWALFEAPAPDLSAVEWKIKKLAEYRLSFQADIAARLLADLQRLSGRA